MASVPGENRCAKAEAFCETWDKGCTAFVAKQWECCTELGTEFLPNRHGTQRCFDNLRTKSVPENNGIFHMCR